MMEGRNLRTAGGEEIQLWGKKTAFMTPAGVVFSNLGSSPPPPPSLYQPSEGCTRV